VGVMGIGMVRRERERGGEFAIMSEIVELGGGRVVGTGRDMVSK
jgi:hypothetical protein